MIKSWNVGLAARCWACSRLPNDDIWKWCQAHHELATKKCQSTGQSIEKSIHPERLLLTTSLLKSCNENCICLQSKPKKMPLLPLVWCLPSFASNPALTFHSIPETITRNPRIKLCLKRKSDFQSFMEASFTNKPFSNFPDSTTRDLETKTDTQQLQLGQGSQHKHGQTFKLWVRGFRAVGEELASHKPTRTKQQLLGWMELGLHYSSRMDGD